MHPIHTVPPSPAPSQLPNHGVPPTRQMLTAQVFCKRDLPDQCRLVRPGTMVTKDFRPERLNVHVDDNGTVSHVYHG